MKKLTQEEIFEECGIKDFSIKELTKKDLKSIDKNNLTGFFYSEWGAMGWPGLTMVVEGDLHIFYKETCKDSCDISQVEISQLYKDFKHVDGFLADDFGWTRMDEKPWMYFNLGMGNHLYLRGDLYKKIGNYIFDVYMGRRYGKWLDLTGIENIIN